MKLSSMSSWLPLRKTTSAGALLELQQQIDDLARGGAAIDVVADENHRVAEDGRDCLEHHGEFVDTAVNIADRKEPGREMEPFCARAIGDRYSRRRSPFADRRAAPPSSARS